MSDIKYIAFACYPPRSETSHNKGLVDLHLRHISHVLLSITVDCYVYFKEMLLRRLRSCRMCCTCRCLYRCVDVQADLCCILP
jgi:hypothetical protein